MSDDETLRERLAEAWLVFRRRVARRLIGRYVQLPEADGFYVVGQFGLTTMTYRAETFNLEVNTALPPYPGDGETPTDPELLREWLDAPRTRGAFSGTVRLR